MKIRNAVKRGGKSKSNDSISIRNPLRLDPSRTGMLRKAFTAKIRGQFRKLRMLVIDLIATQDALGLKERQPFTGNEAHQYGCAMFAVKDAETVAELQRLQAQLDPADVVKLETDPHITVRYGFEHDDDTQLKLAVMLVAGGYMPVTARIGQLSVFHNEDADVLKFAIDSPRIDDLYRQFGLLPNVETHSDYQPHITVAYLKPGTADKYVDFSTSIVGRSLLFTSMDYADTEGSKFALNDQWRFHSDPEKLRAFKSWLSKQMDSTVRGKSERDLWEAYVQAGFEKGAGRSFDDFSKNAPEKLQGKMDFYDGTRKQFLRDTFARPETVEKVQLIAARTFDDLVNVTDAMATKMGRVLADGLTQGMNPRDVATELADTIDIEEARAETIARTEIIRAHAEGQLDAMEALGVEDVGVMVEWSTALDERVCFPAWTLVETDTGLVPIQQIKVDDRVKTRNGLRKVKAINNRSYTGQMVRVDALSTSTYSTADHPYWTDRGWVEAGGLKQSDLLETIGNQSIKIDSLVDFFIGDANNEPSSRCEEISLSRIAFEVLMPVGSIDLKSDFHIRNKKVNGVPTDASFLDELYSEISQGNPNSLFDGCFDVGSAVARKRAKLSCCIPRGFPKRLTTGRTFDEYRWSAALLRTMPSDKISDNVGSFVKKALAATFTRDVNPSLRFDSTGNGAVRIATCDVSADSNRLTASKTQLDDHKPTRLLVASSAAESAHCHSASVDHLPTSRTSDSAASLSRLCVALMRAESFITGVLHRLSSSLERFATVGAHVFKRHCWTLLGEFNVLYHRLRGIPITVYDIEVEADHEFYANGLLVHNCPLCEPMEGVTFSLEEAHGMIPRHPNCRCSFIPANVGEDTEGQTRDAGGIRDAISESMDLEGKQLKEDGWGAWGTGKDIADDRPESILDNRRHIADWANRLGLKYSDNGHSHIDPAIGTFSQLLQNVFCATGVGGGQDNSCGRDTGATGQSKSDIAKAAHVYVGADIQRYSEEHNEPMLAKMLGGRSMKDNEPVDIVMPSTGGPKYGIELKTMVVGNNNKITMKADAMERKSAWERKNKASIHTVVFDDRRVYNAHGPGKHDDGARRIFYRRGYGSFRVESMHEVTGGVKELKKLIDTPKRQLPKAAK